MELTVWPLYAALACLSLALILYIFIFIGNMIWGKKDKQEENKQ